MPICSPASSTPRDSSWERIAAYLYLDFNGLFGLPLLVTGNIIVAFIFFGQALYASGGDRFFTDLALSIFGGFRGGAAKVAIISSSLFGMVSGSAVSNVIISGSITIPMMKRAGYPGRLAAAIEAVASTGGQIAPPVMGTAAFLIAMILNTQYREVVIAAAIPAFLYYVALFTQVDLEAAKRNFPSLPADQLPKFGAVMKRGWVFLVPLAFLIFTLLVLNWQPGKAAVASAVLVFGVGALKRETRPTWRQLLTAVRETGRIVLYIVTIAALAGFVIGSLHLSGFAFKIPLLMLSIAGGSTELLLLLTAFACIVLGMGMPTAVVYLMLAILVAPALVQLGVVPMAAHMFVFYFGMLSMITPPVCISTYAACAIAGENFWRTGLTGARLGIVAFLVPFVVALNPAIIFRGTGYDIALALVTTSAGVALLSVAVVGHLARPLDVWGACGGRDCRFSSAHSEILWHTAVDRRLGRIHPRCGVHARPLETGLAGNGPLAETGNSMTRALLPGSGRKDRLNVMSMGAISDVPAQPVGRRFGNGGTLSPHSRLVRTSV